MVTNMACEWEVYNIVVHDDFSVIVKATLGTNMDD